MVTTTTTSPLEMEHVPFFARSSNSHHRAVPKQLSVNKASSPLRRLLMRLFLVLLTVMVIWAVMFRKRAGEPTNGMSSGVAGDVVQVKNITETSTSTSSSSSPNKPSTSIDTTTKTETTPPLPPTKTSTTTTTTTSSLWMTEPPHNDGKFHLPLPPEQVTPLMDDDEQSALGSNSNTDLAQALKSRFQTAKTRLLEKLQADYGTETFDAIFNTNNADSNVGRIALASPSSSTVSWERLKRKLLIKLLQAHAAAAATSSTTADSSNAHRIPFVWASGGHSAAAGHGNLYNQSYTATLHRNLQPLFSQVGLHFEGRNYAMGGTSSAPEVAWCEDAVFGLDMDVLSWDFGMTDGHNWALMAMYFYHAGIHPNRPACVGLQFGSKAVNRKISVLKDLEERGLTTLFLQDPVVGGQVIAKIPDSFGLNDTDLEQLAPYVRNFKCNGAVEKGDPYCGKEKFTSSVCPSRRFKTSWHPGWKWHALIGNIISLSLMEILSDALDELASSKNNGADPKAWLAQLKAEEDKDYELFFQSELPEVANSVLKSNKLEADAIDLELLFKKRGICHTGRLPAETRFKGILTESPLVGFDTYDKGTTTVEAQKAANDNEWMRLVYDNSPKNRQICDVRLNMDFKDFFWVNHADGWQKIVLPNDAEMQVYAIQQPLQGVIAICLGSCSWGKCAKGDVREDAISTGLLEMEVNGVKVSNMTAIYGCRLLRHEGGVAFPLNDKGRLELRARVTEEGSYVRFSSFIVW